MSNLRLLHRSITAEELFLHLAERRTRLNEVDRLNAGRKRLEVPESL